MEFTNVEWFPTYLAGVCDPNLIGVDPLLDKVDVEDEIESSSEMLLLLLAFLLLAILCATVVCNARLSRALGFVGRFFSLIVSTSISSSVQKKRRGKNYNKIY